jgi:hypothetical protein
MADRYGYQFTSSLIPRVWLIDGYVSVGASGAVLNTAAGTNLDAAGQPIYLPKGVKSIVRSSAGLYVISLGDSSGLTTTDTYVNVVNASIVPVCSTPTNINGQVVSWNLASGGLSTKVTAITVRFQTGGVETDLPSGSGWLFTLHMKNSQV